MKRKKENIGYGTMDTDNIICGICGKSYNSNTTIHKCGSTNLLKKEFEERFVSLQADGTEGWGVGLYLNDKVMPNGLWEWFESKLIGEKQDNIKVVWNEVCEKIREDSVREFVKWYDSTSDNMQVAIDDYLKSKSGGIKK
jgi:hypothetical protein